MDNLYETMHKAYMKKIRCVEKDGTIHKGVEDMLCQRADEDDGVPGIGISDGTFLKENEIESIEILDEENDE